MTPLPASMLLGFLFGSLAQGTGETGSCGAQCVTQGSNLMQVNSDVVKSTSELLQSRALATKSQHLMGSERAALLARQFREEPPNIAQALRRGLEGIQASIRLFQQDPPDVAGGISSLGDTLLDSVGLVITEEGQESWPDWERFRDAWTQTFQDFTTTLTAVRQNLESFAASGETEHLIAALSQILSQASDTALDRMPGDLATEVSSYLEALNRAFASVGEAIREFDAGDTLGGIEEIYFGLRNATQGLIPSSIRTDATYSTIVGLLDNIVGGISQDIHEYRRRISESTTCWKVSQSRSRRLPRHCPAGFHWDGERHCWPQQEATCWEMAPDCVPSFTYRGDRYHNCTGVNHAKHWCSHNEEYRWRQWSNCQEVPCSPSLLSRSLDKATVDKRPRGTIPARCDDSDDSEFAEKSGGWCYADCPLGYEAFGARCWTECGGERPADSRLMCGRDPGVLASTITEMVVVTARSAFSLATAITSMQAVGVNADNLGSTIQTFIDMGQPFALPTCPTVGV
mmetsp:Transcript_24175/g.50256  ORF Transcript_24175/g.50256 Transcript_24175/m.50256 type:complete len:515 (+) Transcript_24175:22-1566(+)